MLIDWLARLPADARALYILGDLFEAWIGDDAEADPGPQVISALRRLTDAGVHCAFQHGNRDFLVGPAFAEHSGATLLPEEIVVDLGGLPTLLLHGDQLCTADHAYQSFRQQVRDPAWQRAFLSQPVSARRAYAERARAESARHTGETAQGLMDVEPEAVRQALRRHRVRRMIHGHTHRPAFHHFDLDGASAERIVLGDWYAHGSALRIDASDCRRVTIAG